MQQDLMQNDANKANAQLAKANVDKAKAETENIEAETMKIKADVMIANDKARAERLRERQKLAAEGISQDEIDAALPLNFDMH
eukprot:8941139-Ditylum_brightwellii.AAC.1